MAPVPAVIQTDSRERSSTFSDEAANTAIAPLSKFSIPALLVLFSAASCGTQLSRSFAGYSYDCGPVAICEYLRFGFGIACTSETVERDVIDSQWGTSVGSLSRYLTQRLGVQHAAFEGDKDTLKCVVSRVPAIALLPSVTGTLHGHYFVVSRFRDGYVELIDEAGSQRYSTSVFAKKWDRRGATGIAPSKDVTECARLTREAWFTLANQGGDS